MGRSRCCGVVLAVSFLVLPAGALRGGEEELLSQLIAKSPLVVAGRVSSEPLVLSVEAGLVQYSFGFALSEVFKGERPKEPVLSVTIGRLGSRPAERLNLKKGEEYILFLRPAKGKQTQFWTNADAWFGVEPNRPSLASAIRRTVDPAGEIVAALPALDDRCTADADCGVVDLLLSGPYVCCMGCGFESTTAGNRDWVQRIRAACAVVKRADGPLPGCPPLACPAGPSRATCVQGRCQKHW